MKKLASILFLLLVISQLNSQPWIKLITKDKAGSQSIGFYSLQEAFHQYWSGKNLADKHVTKGKGYKPFKRWEEFMIPRVYPDGQFPANQTWLAYQQEKKQVKLKTTPVSNWTHLGPLIVPLDNNGEPSGMGRINCVAFHPTNPDILFVGAPSGGFWKSIDAGNTWITTTDELPSIGVSDIAINPTNPDIIYIATGDGDASDTYSIGILKSLDGGHNWGNTGLNWTTDNNIIIRRVIINPIHTDTLLAASTSGIFRSVDAGLNWTNVQTGHFKDLEFNPSNPEIIYAARYGNNNSRFYKSTDGGSTFAQIATGVDLSKTYRLELAVSKADANIIYALYSDNDQDGFHSLWKSINAGDSWLKIYDASGINLLGWESDGSDIGGQGWYDLSMVVSPIDATVVYVGGVNIWKSINSGVDWSIVGHWWGDNAQYVHADHHYLAYSPSGVLYNGNDGGLYKTSDEGSNWMDISDGLQILQIDRIGSSQNSADVILMGNQDNGTMKYNTASNSWRQIYGGDGAECIVDYNADNVIYVSYVNGDLKRSTDGGASFLSIKPQGTGDGAWHTPLVMSANENETLFTGFNDVWKTTNRGTNWQKISENLSPDDPLKQITVAPSNFNYLYVSTGSEFWSTKNGGISWRKITSPELTGLFITSVSVSDNNPERVWVAVSGFKVGKKVFYSEDAGETWINFSEGLPNVPINCIIRERQSDDIFYLGTDIGVYYRDASISSWVNFSTALPVVVISDLELQYSSGLLRAGTRGRGLWQTSVIISAPEVPRLIGAETSSDGTKVELTFDKSMTDPTGKQTEFIINNGLDIFPLSASLKPGTNNIYVLELLHPLISNEIVTVSYTEGSVKSADNYKLASFVKSGVQNKVITQIKEIDNSKHIKVFPNPNEGIFQIEFSGLKAYKIEIKLINTIGQIVYAEKVLNREKFMHQVNISGLATGKYYLIIQTKTENYQKAILVN